jgi:hypothetical protein
VSRAQLTKVLDWLALAFLLISLVLYFTGGFYLAFDGGRVSARDPLRAALVALAIAALRYWLDRSPPLPSLVHALYDPRADPRPESAPARRAGAAAWLRWAWRS